jgi:peroxiredoxin
MIMTGPTRPTSSVPEHQQRAFEKALAERLGIDPETAVLDGWTVEGGEEPAGRVRITFLIDGDELLEMFNTGKARPRR